MSATRKNPRMLPVIIPATIVNPPRTSGLPAARATVASSLSSSGPVRPAAMESGARGLGGDGLRSRKGSIVIRMVGHFFHILDIPDDVVGVEHENRAALDPQVLYESAIRFAKGAAAMVR